jgi:formylglycine-generating enzyme required for sulfatase activity
MSKDEQDSAYRVYRGGGWINPPALARVAFRYWLVPGNRFDLLGVRLVRRRSALERLLGDSPQESEEQPEVRR